MWPVFSDVATALGHEILSALGGGHDPCAVVAELVKQTRDEAGAWRRFHSLRAFVVWE